MILIDNRNSSDPRLNLALEEYVVRTRKEGDYLLVYINEPTVVIGKHQNALEEINHTFAGANGIRLVRRISGGGAVYHDEGNLNFSLITDHSPEKHNNYLPFLSPVLDLLTRMGVEGRLNNRNSLVLSDGRKFSGNAQFASRGRMMSHGTLLFNTNLSALTSVLSPEANVENSKAVQSVRSDVVNLREELSEEIDQEVFTQELIRSYAGLNPTVEVLAESEWREVEELARTKYDSWEWNFGRTPKFVVRQVIESGGAFLLRVEDGVIQGVIPDAPETSLNYPFQTLVGKPFSFEKVADFFRQVREGEGGTV
ncbi:MAG: lipoate--protein ligase [Ignavibacteriae bacterium]|nr:lipoate--protein ligase [Ignavibacteriota bacterium]MCB9217335.1 lipoate--protein ligase [Ignavibacteria bacterium]